MLDLSAATIGFARRWQLFDASFGGVLIFGDLESDLLRRLHLEQTGDSFVSDIASDITTDSVVSRCCLWGDRHAYVVGRSTDRSQTGLVEEVGLEVGEVGVAPLELCLVPSAELLDHAAGAWPVGDDHDGGAASFLRPVHRRSE